MQNICVFTGTRAEYGILKGLIRAIEVDSEFHLQLFVSGSHLSSEFGMTITEIEQDGFKAAKKVEILLSSVDSPQAMLKAMGRGLTSYGDALLELKPDLCLVLGDRFEALAFAISANISGIPVAHLHGGELTFGALDDCMRHAITKMAHLHFPATEEYRNRVIQLGEDPGVVINAGALGAENINEETLMDRTSLEKYFGMDLTRETYLVTYHPETNSMEVTKGIDELFASLEKLNESNLIFTLANADAGGRVINEKIKLFCEQHPNAKYYESLGRQRYFSVLSFAKAVIGNSSSGLIEAPSFKVPTINIGDRQQGRTLADSVISCKNKMVSIDEAIEKINHPEFQKTVHNTVNPYYKKGSKDIILNGIKSFLKSGKGTQKGFYTIK